MFLQDLTHLNNILPPSLDEIQDTVCAVFVGKTKLTPKTIEGLRPVLVRKMRVRTIMTFLMVRIQLTACVTGRVSVGLTRQT